MTPGKKTEKAVGGSEQNAKNVPAGCVICERLRDLRDKRGFTQKKLSDETGIHFQTVSRLERVHSKVGTDTLVRLARFFDVPCGYLLGEEKINIGSQLEGQPEFVAHAARFVELLRVKQAYKPTELLKVFCAMLEADPMRLAHDKARMVDEEESFGLWWSALAAYERADWDSMILRADQLKELGERLGRPFLIAVGRVYKAQALCRRDRDVDLAAAYRELANVPEDSQLFESALVTRLRAKVLRRQGNVQDAIRLCEKAEQLINANKRDDALHRLERVKLQRYLGVLHSRSARQIAKERVSDCELHMQKADEYFDRCEGVLHELDEELPREGSIEAMLLAFARARHFELYEDYKKSLETAQKALRLAEKNQDDDYVTKVRMFLVHIAVQLGNEDELSLQYAQLVPVSKYKTGKFAKYYRQWVSCHKDTIAESM